GIILDRAIINIISKEFTSRLQYIAVSRVRTINNLIFKKPFDFSLFTNCLRPTRIAYITNIERR
ncbi:uncharacterized protein SEPMUDRAFT_48462, partial [Sphaerulina musiva SO2202]